MQARVVCLILLSGILGACSGSSLPTTLDPYSILTKDDSFLASANKLSGSASIIFDDSVGELRSTIDYELEFHLEDGGSVRLYSHASSTLTYGLEIVWSRSGSTLSGAMVRSSSQVDISSLLTDFDAAEKQRFYVRVNNSTSPAQVGIWVTAGQVESEALLNSSTSEDFEAPGKGSGIYWGLGITSAAVTYAKIR